MPIIDQIYFTLWNEFSGKFISKTENYFSEVPIWFIDKSNLCLSLEDIDSSLSVEEPSLISFSRLLRILQLHLLKCFERWSCATKSCVYNCLVASGRLYHSCSELQFTQGSRSTKNATTKVNHLWSGLFGRWSVEPAVRAGFGSNWLPQSRDHLESTSTLMMNDDVSNALNFHTLLPRN